MPQDAVGRESAATKNTASPSAESSGSDAQEPPEPRTPLRGARGVAPDSRSAIAAPAQPGERKCRKPRRTGPAVVGAPGVTAQARTGIRAGAPALKTGMKPGFRPVVIIPVYNQTARLPEVVADVRKLALPIILVDDGSDLATRSVCDRLAEPGVRVIHRPVNGGKGAAVIDGFKAAGRAGFTHALQIDADGQHDRAVIPKFITLGQKFPSALICGYPLYDASAPLSRRFGRKLTNFWASINSLSLSFEDAMCGLRLYPLEPVLALVENVKLGLRMQFDPEILVRLLWAGLRVKNIPVRVTYPPEGVSHFKAFADNARISAMHAKLCVLMLTRLPIILFSRICGRDPECQRAKPLADRPSEGAALGKDAALRASAAAKAPGAASPRKPESGERLASPLAGTRSAKAVPAKQTAAAPVPGTMRAFEAARDKQATPEDLERAKRATRAAALAQAQAEARLNGISGKTGAASSAGAQNTQKPAAR